MTILSSIVGNRASVHITIVLVKGTVNDALQRHQIAEIAVNSPTETRPTSFACMVDLTMKTGAGGGQCNGQNCPCASHMRTPASSGNLTQQMHFDHKLGSSYLHLQAAPCDVMCHYDLPRPSFFPPLHATLAGIWA
jgi:hypothetical protein